MWSQYRTTKRISERVMNAPTVDEDLQLYWLAYRHLQNDRDMGMGVGAIRWQTIEYYAERNEFSEEQTRLLHRFVGALDTVHREFLNTKRKK